MSSFIASRLFAAAALCVAAAPVAAMAAEPTYEVKYAVVSTSGLDLTTDQGKTALNTRIHDTAVTLCGAPTSYEPRELGAIRACRVKAIADAQTQVQARVQTAQAQRQTAALRVSANEQN